MFSNYAKIRLSEDYFVGKRDIADGNWHDF